MSYSKRLIEEQKNDKKKKRRDLYRLGGAALAGGALTGGIVAKQTLTKKNIGKYMMDTAASISKKIAADPRSLAFLILFDLSIVILSQVYSIPVLRASMLKINKGNTTSQMIIFKSGCIKKIYRIEKITSRSSRLAAFSSNRIFNPSIEHQKASRIFLFL